MSTQCGLTSQPKSPLVGVEKMAVEDKVLIGAVQRVSKVKGCFDDVVAMFTAAPRDSQEFAKLKQALGQ